MYTLERASLISEQLRKFTDSYAFMLSGQFANIDFWLDEVQSALKAIDGHKNRFDKMYNGQKKWIEDHSTRIPNYCAICNGICEFSDPHGEVPDLPQKKWKSEKVEIRKELVNTTYFFLARCYRIGLLDDDEIKKRCDAIGTSIDPNDLIT